MGIFDFFKPKPAATPVEANADGPTPKYVLAHLALRQIALTDPLSFLGIMASPEATRFLNSLIEEIGTNCGQQPTFNASAVTIHTKRCNAFPCVVLELPEPDEMAEAYMVALVWPVDPETSETPSEITTPGRYFTLEKTYSLSGEPGTVLAEWADDAHANFGAGPSPIVEKFVATISEYL